MESTAPAFSDGDSAGAFHNSSDDEGSWDLEKHNADIIRLIENNDPDFTYLSIVEDWNEASDDDTYILDCNIDSLGKLIGKNNRIREFSMKWWLDDTYGWSKGALKAFFE